jgi:glycosyltransferase involved in cell wall biosynthesis
MNKPIPEQRATPFLSVVVPIYNEVESVERLWQAIHPVMEALGKSWEVILVDDGSRDGTRDILRRLAAQNPRLRVILFRANFGQSAAMAAGFAATRGEIVIAMDGDLQNDPLDIPNLLARMEEGYDVVSGWRKHRKDKLVLRKVPSRIANKLICSLTDVQLHDTGCSLKAFRGDMLRRISLYGELHRFIPALMRIEGAEITELPVRHHPRRFGTSKYNLSRTFRVVMDLTSIRLMMKYLVNPLVFFSALVFFFLLCGVGSLAAILYMVIGRGADLAEMNILLTLTAVFWTAAGQFLFFGLIGKLIVNTGSRKTFLQIGQ